LALEFPVFTLVCLCLLSECCFRQC